MASRFPTFIDQLIAQRGDERNTRTLLSHLGRMLGRSPRFTDLTERTLTELLNRLAVQVKPDTIRRYRASLQEVCRHAAIAGRIEREPDLPTAEQLLALAGRLRSQTPAPVDKPKRRRRQPDFPRHYIIAAPRPERTLLHFYESSYRPLRLADASEQTDAVYRSVINRFGWYLSTEPTFDHLTDEALEEFLAWARRAGRSAATANRLRSHLLAIWRHAWRKRKVDDQPRDVQKHREPKRLPEAWSLPEFERIIAAAGQVRGTIAGVPAGLWWRSLLLTLFDTGLRHQAAMKARSIDLDAERQTLFVPADHQKQKADQLFALHADTVRLLCETQPAGRQLLFPWPGRMRDVRDAYRSILKAAGLPHGPKHLFHKLRRTSGSHLAAATDDGTAQRHLGHSSPSVTARYLDPRIVRRLAAADLMERPRV